MKTTYERTMFIPDLTEAIFRVKVCDELVWKAQDYAYRLDYTGVKAWTLVEGGEEAKAIEQEIGDHPDLLDEYHKYLILHFEDGHDIRFRGSYTDLFIF